MAQKEAFELLRDARIADGIQNPTLMILSGKDRVVSNEKAKEFYKEIKS